MSSLLNKIKANKSKVFRRAYIKRRDTTTGLFENDWFEISPQVKKWGKIQLRVDDILFSKFSFNSVNLVVSNDEGEFNTADEENSHWYGYADQQRTLVKIECGFTHETLSSGIWYRTEYPCSAKWDVARFDLDCFADDNQSSVFRGIISGDITLSDRNEVTLPILPVQQIFRDFSAENLAGLSNSLTASDFVTLVRDMTDGAGAFVFRPFFDNTTTQWEIQTTTNVYTSLDTSTAEAIRGKNVWEVMEALAVAENYVVYVNRGGKFRFVPRDPNTSTSNFLFYGRGFFDTEYGHTIKKINKFGKAISKFYSRVRVKFGVDETTSSYHTVESTLTVSPTNNPWLLGEKTLDITNLFISDSTQAATIATTVFNEVSATKKEIDFTTSLIPHLDILDRINLSYDSQDRASDESLWDIGFWAEDVTLSANDLIWDATKGESIYLQNEEMKFLSISLDLDKLETQFVARET